MGGSGGWIDPADDDADVLTDEEEAAFGTDPSDPDSDRDGIIDNFNVMTLSSQLGQCSVRSASSSRLPRCPRR